VRTRALAAFAAVFALIVGSVVATSTTPASALSSGVSFAAEDSSTWQTNGVVYALGTAKGKVIAGGSFSELRPPAGGAGTAQSRPALAILDAETGEPDSCQFPVTLNGATPSVRAIVVSEDESTVYIGGNFASVGGVYTARIAALDVASCTVSAFRAPLPSSVVTALALKGDVLYAGGRFRNVGGETRESFAAFNATTGSLLDWRADALRVRTDLPREVAEARSVAVSPDGSKVVVGGDLFQINGVPSHSIAMVSGASGPTGAGGTVLRTYPDGFIPDSSVTKAIIDGGDGKFYIGNEGTGGGVFDGRAAFSWSTGDQVWRDNCLGATQALAMYAGTLYSASHAHDCAAINAFNDGIRRYFLAQDPETMQIHGWLPIGNDGTGEGIGPRALVVATGATTGKKFLWSGGEFTLINRHAQQGLTRFGPDDVDAPPAPVATAQATSDGAIQVRFRTVVDPDDSDLTYRVYRNNGATPVWTGSGKSLWWERPQVTFVDSDVTPGINYSYRVDVTDGSNTSGLSASTSARAVAAGADYSNAVRQSGASSYWSGAATGSWLHDTAGTASRANAIPAILMDGATTTTTSAIPGTAGSMRFDGSNDYAATDQYRPGLSTYSVEAWINTTTTSGGKIVGFGNGRPRTDTNAGQLSGNYDRHIYMHNDGRVSFGVYTGSSVTLTSATALNDGQWHHLVATQGPEGMRFYVDGLRAGANGVRDAQQYWGVWRVGGDNLGGWPNQPSSNFFGGLIDEVAIYPTSLPATDVAEHYVAAGGHLDLNAAPTDAYGAAVFGEDPTLYWRLDDADSTARDASLFGTADGAYNTGATTAAQGVIDQNAAVRLSGDESGTVATLERMTPSSPMSAEVWFKTDTTVGGKLFGFENTPTGNGGNYDKHLYMANDGRLVWGSWIGSAATVESNASYNDNRWHQAVVILDGAGRKLYVDGALVASNGTTGAETGEGYWRIGGGNIGGWPSQPTSFYFAGSLDEFSVYPKTLSAESIQAHYELGIADSTAPTAPTGVTGVADAGGVHLTWTASTDENSIESYRVYRGANADFVADESSLVGESDTTELTDPTAAPGIHYYRVAGVDQSGNVSEPSSSILVEVPDTSVPSAPPAPTVELSGPGGVTVSWEAATDDIGVVEYEIHRSSEQDFETTAANRVGSTSSLSYVDVAVLPGSYAYKIVARDAAGNRSPASAAATVSVPVPDTIAPTSPGDLTVRLDGTDAALKWTASDDNVAITGYDVYRGTSEDYAIDPTLLVGTVEGTDFRDADLPPGTYYYQVVARDSSGNGSVPAKGSLLVTDIVPPSTPTDLTATVSAGAVELSWAPATDVVGVVGYDVFRGSSAAFVADEASKIGDTTGLEFSDMGASAGTAYYRVAARDAAGNVGAATSAVAATVADSTAPTVPGDLTATVAADDVTLTWTASTDAVGVIAYDIHRGTTPEFVPAVSNRIAEATTTTYLDQDRPNGTIFYKVIARDEAGNPSSPATTSAVVATAEPVTVTLDVVDDAMVLQTIPTTNHGSNVQLAVLGTNLQQQAFLSFDLPVAPAGTQLSSVVLRVRTSDDAKAASVDTAAIDLVRGAWKESEVTWNNRPMDVVAGLGTLAGIPTLNTPAAASLSVGALQARLGTEQTIRLSSAGTDNLRLWSSEARGVTYRPTLVLEFTPIGADTSAPTAPVGLTTTVNGTTANISWQPSSDNVAVSGYELYRGTAADFAVAAGSRVWQGAELSFADADRPVGTYYYRVVALDNAGNVSAVSDVVSATIAPPDGEAPTAPGTPSATVSGADIALSWTAASDNAGVTGYSVHRGSSESFTADASNRIAQVDGTAHTDVGVAPGTYYYKVVARDAAGNVGAASGPASATIAGVPVTKTVTVAVEGDATVFSALPTNNYGTLGQLASRGAADNKQESFLRFTLPTLPEGATLTGAALAIRTSTDPTASSLDTHTVTVITDPWDPAAVTWVTRPTSAAAAPLGVLTIAPALNTPYTVALDAGQVAALAGQTVTLRITGTGSDNLRIYSQDVSPASYRPAVTLTYVTP
jgi:fibronectin type 3 domain-containing protein